MSDLLKHSALASEGLSTLDMQRICTRLNIIKDSARQIVLDYEDNIDDYAKTRTPAFEGVTFDESVKEIMTNCLRDMLRKLMPFEFERHPKYNLSNQWRKITEKWIQRRAGELLK